MTSTIKKSASAGTRKSHPALPRRLIRAHALAAVLALGGCALQPIAASI